MLAGMERPTSNFERVEIRWAVVVLLVTVGATLLTLTGRGLAFSGGEIYGHLWTWWWHGEALPDWPDGTALASGTSQWPVIDPLLCALGGGLARLTSLTFSWNFFALAGVAGAAAGGAWLADRAGGNPWVGGAVLASAPIFWGSLLSGLSEDLALGLLALVCGLAWLPSGANDWRRWLGLGLCLGALAWCGLYLFWMGALLALLGALMEGRALRHTAHRWAVAAGVALVMATPIAWEQGERLSGEGHSFGEVQTRQEEPSWKVNPWHAMDVASLVVPGRADVPEQAIFRLHPAYLGLIALALASRGRGRRWWLLLGGASLAACGPVFRVCGLDLGVTNPVVYVLNVLPGGSLIHHHGRLLMAGVLGLTVLAARGWSGWVERYPAMQKWRRGVGALIACEVLLLGPLSFDAYTTSMTPRDFGVEAVEGGSDGWLLTVPVAGPGVHPQRPLYDQTAHGHAVLVDPNRPGAPAALHKSATGRWLVQVSRSASAAPLDGFDWCAIAREDVRILVVTEAFLSSVSPVLGTPDFTGSDGAGWHVEARCEAGAASNRRSPGVGSGEMIVPERG